MSTNSECEFVERKPGEWFYILEDYSAPKNSWNWREFATCYGPFASYDVATEHLRNNHPNPGGHMLVEFAEFTTDATYEQHFKEATR